MGSFTADGSYRLRLLLVDELLLVGVGGAVFRRRLIVPAVFFDVCCDVSIAKLLLVVGRSSLDSVVTSLLPALEHSPAILFPRMSPTIVEEIDATGNVTDFLPPSFLCSLFFNNKSEMRPTDLS